MEVGAELSAAEKRRIERRRKILNNQENRLSKIVGKERAEDIMKSTKDVQNTDDSVYSVKDNVEDLVNKQPWPSVEANLTNHRNPTDKVAPNEPEDDGGFVLPKLPFYFGRIGVCVLALTMSLMKVQHFTSTFVSWEFAYLYMNGLPENRKAPMIVVALAIFGFQEKTVLRIKHLIIIIDIFLTDMSLFVFVAMLPVIFKQIFS